MRPRLALAMLFASLVGCGTSRAVDSGDARAIDDSGTEDVTATHDAPVDATDAASDAREPADGQAPPDAQPPADGCVAKTCAGLDATCGTADDGCGGTLQCGTCAAGSVCTAGACVCTPTTCAKAGATCGSIPDGCGLSLACGTCTGSNVCGGGGANKCGPAACTPTTCKAQDKNCGTISDGCSSSLSCGTCVAPATCGGGGADNVCGCTPTTCEAKSATCGSTSDGCGGTLDCGACASPLTCGGAGAPNTCGCSGASCTRACTVANGTGSQTFAGGAWGPCHVTACNPTFVTVNNACVASTQSCAITHGTGVQALINGSYGACVATSCAAGYSLANGACIAASALTAVTACGNITASGHYYLTGDLVSTNANYNTWCLNIENASNVSLDCQGHTITTAWGALYIDNVTNVSVANCTAVLGATANAPVLVQVTSSNNGSFTGNTFGDTVSNNVYQLELTSSNHFTFVNNKLNVWYTQMSSTYNSFISNVSTSPAYKEPAIIGANFQIDEGSNSTWIGNTIDGRSTGGEDNIDGPSTGADDGIVFLDSAGSDVVVGNIFRNNWDTAVEWEGTLNNVLIANNTMDYEAVTAIGAYYFPGLTNSTISFNTVTHSGQLFDFDKSSGLEPGQTTVMFTNNHFEGNTYSEPVGPDPANPSFILTSLYMLTFDTTHGADAGYGGAPSQYSLLNNTFLNNDFGHGQGPLFCQTVGCTVSTAEVVDQGGNLCSTIGSYPSPLPIACH